MIALLIACRLLTAAPLLAGGGHDFHVARLSVDEDLERQRLRLTIDSFVDDLERALGERAPDGQPLRMGTPREHAAADSLLAGYLARSVRFAVGGENLPLRFLGKEPTDDPYGVYVFAEVALPAGYDAEALELRCRLLTDLHADQENVIVWKRDGRTVDHDLSNAARPLVKRDL